MYPRIQQLRKLFASLGVDAFWVSHPSSLAYLTGQSLFEGWLLVTPDQIFYLTDPRYAAEVRPRLKGIQVRVFTAGKPLFVLLREILSSSRVRRIGFHPARLSLAFYRKLKSQTPSGISWHSREDVLEGLRMIKAPAELKLIKIAISHNINIFRYIEKNLRFGMTENELLRRLQAHLNRRGLKFSFDPIIASGPNSAYPHARVTDRVIRKNDLVLVDMGIDFCGYKSDLTRIFFLGKIPALIRQTAEIVRAAQREAIAQIRPGIQAAAIDQTARKFLSQKKLDRFFTHSLGHGVGLEIHERPVISRSSKTILQPGMVFTVEPAVYIPDKFGIRMEDMILVTTKGHEILSRP